MNYGLNKGSFSIIVVFIALAIVGCALLPLLPVKLTPTQTLPTITVGYSMPGVSARIAEQEVTSKIESALARVVGVKGIDSKSYKGGGRISVSLDRHADMDNVRFEVSTLIRRIWNEMPEGVSYPNISVRQVDSEASCPFITFTLNAPANPSEILAYGEENLSPILSKVGGVGKVEFIGAQPMEWKLYYDIDQLSAIGITPTDIRNAINEHLDSKFLGVASIGNDGEEWLRISMKAGNSLDGFNPSEISLTAKDGTSVSLDNITNTIHEESAPNNYFRINGLNSIYVNITAEEEANQLRVAKDIEDALEAFSPSMPAGYMIDKAYDATEEIHAELDKIYFRTGLTILILLLFVALVSLSVRYVLMITIGLVINLAVAVLFYYFTKIEIQLYSLAGITISLNLIIDNLIVMADHYTRRRNIGVFTSILAATLTTIGALAVVFFMDEKTRLSLQDFVTVVIINLAVSLAVALFLVPALIEKLGIHKSSRKGMFRKFMRKAAHCLSNIYERSICLILEFRSDFIIILVLGFAGGLYLFVEKVYDGSYWDRNPGEPVLNINATLPNGATLEQMNVLIKKMEAYLCDFPEIRQFQTSVSSPNRASISVFFEKAHQRDGFPYRLKGDVVSKALTLGGGSWSVYGLDDMGFNNDVRENAGSYCVKMTGYNYDDLYDWAYRMRDTLLTHRRIKEVTIASEYSYWKDDYSEFYIDIDREMLAKTGLSASQLFSAIEPTFGKGISSGSITTDNGSEMIRLYSMQRGRYDVFALMNQPFRVGERSFKLSDFGHIDKRQTPQEIVKKNQEYVLCLQYEYIGSPKQGERVLEKDIEKINSILPVGYKAENQKNIWRPKDDSAKYWLLLLVVGIIFFITSILFNSLRIPISIIFIIPVSFIGVFLTFYLLRLNFDQGGFASFILLSGITVNAAIYVASEYLSQRSLHPDISSIKTFVRAIRIKITPILLTVLSTVFGFIPFLIGDTKEGFWFPLAAGTIGGLVMSMIGLLFYLPIFLLRKRDRMIQKSGAR